MPISKADQLDSAPAAQVSSAVDECKPCKTCSRVLPLEQYPLDVRTGDGHSGVCGECTRVRWRAWARRNRDRINALARLYYRRNPEAAKAKAVKWRRANPQAARLINRRFKAAKREKLKEYDKQYAAANPHKIRAQSAVACAVLRGRLIRQDCEICGACHGRDGQIVNAHHEDYSRPLEVRWLCARHHRQLHAGKFCLLPPFEEYYAQVLTARTRGSLFG